MCLIFVFKAVVFNEFNSKRQQVLNRVARIIKKSCGFFGLSGLEHGFFWDLADCTDLGGDLNKEQENYLFVGWFVIMAISMIPTLIIYNREKGKAIQ